MIRGLLNKVYSWLFSSDSGGPDIPYWTGTEWEDFYNHIDKKRYSSALDIIRDKPTRYSFEEMSDLMKAFERDVIGGQKLVISKESSDLVKKTPEFLQYCIDRRIPIKE